MTTSDCLAKTNFQLLSISYAQIEINIVYINSENIILFVSGSVVARVEQFQFKSNADCSNLQTPLSQVSFLDLTSFGRWE